jgi:biopolymer transport protein ExbD
MAGGGDVGEVEVGPKTNVFGETAPASVHLNLTALMDILSNLLFFLLASFGAAVIMGITAAVPVQSAEKSDVADKAQQVTVAIKLAKTGYEVFAQGSAQTAEELAKLTKAIPVTGDGPDYQNLVRHLLTIKERYPASDTIILTVEPGVSYEIMVKTMDAARERAVKVRGVIRPLKLFPTVVVSTMVK